MRGLIFILAVAVCLGITAGKKNKSHRNGDVHHVNDPDLLMKQLKEGLPGGITSDGSGPKTITRASHKFDGGLRTVVDFVTEKGHACTASWQMVLPFMNHGYKGPPQKFEYDCSGSHVVIGS